MIDDLISKTKKIAIELRKTAFNTRCSSMAFKRLMAEAEEYEQIAEWLGELEELRKMKETIECNAKVLEQQGYNKALDDLDAILVDELEKSENPYESWTLKHILEVMHDKLWKE